MKTIDLSSVSKGRHSQLEKGMHGMKWKERLWRKERCLYVYVSFSLWVYQSWLSGKPDPKRRKRRAISYQTTSTLSVSDTQTLSMHRNSISHSHEHKHTHTLKNKSLKKRLGYVCNPHVTSNMTDWKGTRFTVGWQSRTF